MNTGKLLVGSLAGIAIGALAGILFAPKKGSKTRKHVLDKGDEYVERLKSKYDDFVDSANDKFQGTKKNAENFMEKGKSKYDEAKKDVKNAAANF